MYVCMWNCFNTVWLKRLERYAFRWFITSMLSINITTSTKMTTDGVVTGRGVSTINLLRRRYKSEEYFFYLLKVDKMLKILSILDKARFSQLLLCRARESNLSDISMLDQAIFFNFLTVILKLTLNRSFCVIIIDQLFFI